MVSVGAYSLIRVPQVPKYNQCGFYRFRGLGVYGLGSRSSGCFGFRVQELGV